MRITVQFEILLTSSARFFAESPKGDVICSNCSILSSRVASEFLKLDNHPLTSLRNCLKSEEHKSPMVWLSVHCCNEMCIIFYIYVYFKPNYGFSLWQVLVATLPFRQVVYQIAWTIKDMSIQIQSGLPWSSINWK